MSRTIKQQKEYGELCIIVLVARISIIRDGSGKQLLGPQNYDCLFKAATHGIIQFHQFNPANKEYAADSSLYTHSRCLQSEGSPVGVAAMRGCTPTNMKLYWVGRENWRAVEEEKQPNAPL